MRLGTWPIVDQVRYWRWLNARGYWWFQRPKTRSEFDTRIYEGLPGSGKTLLMVRDCIDLMRSGVVVYSNVYVRDPLTGREALPLGGWLSMLKVSVEALERHAIYRQLVENCVESGGDLKTLPSPPASVVMAFDEIHLAADARSWQSTPAWWLNLMAQRRHFGVGMIGTTQDLSTVEKRLRMLVGRIVQVRPSFIRRFWRRVPLFTVVDVDMSVRGDGVGDNLGGGSWTWVAASAFHGYSTREIMATVDFADLTDDQSVAEVAALTQRAINAGCVDFLDSYADSWSPTGNRWDYLADHSV
jgi:hypothetical protein